ncbi:Non-specific serine/threonine protein kinase protein [Dioscorea alata]|uniref:Non-specific serine/threonine protein kinase protein n=1 Tax=Dioscorea alata TaxID=55571 RepID=A0ACB7UP26_DIOAL|nr:Non-specific serine/threonine protein kinase protein [Dioscorea alata]
MAAMMQMQMLILISLSALFGGLSTSTDTLSPGQPLHDGQTLVSAVGTFILGFFSPAGSNNRYVGIWYNKLPVQTVVWVANRGNHIAADANGTMELNSNGSLTINSMILNNGQTVVWVAAIEVLTNPVAQLLDNGNLVIREANSIEFAWQSFDYPTDTLLSGMKLGWDLRTGLNRNLTAWQSNDDPSPGRYTFSADINGSPQLTLLLDSAKIWRSGPWNGAQFSNTRPHPSGLGLFRFANTTDGVYFIYDTIGIDIVGRLTVNHIGILQWSVWIKKASEWSIFWYVPQTQCDSSFPCGPNAICDINSSPMCQCLQGFVPKFPANWALRNSTSGCVRRMALDCKNKTDGFLTITPAILPDTSTAIVDTTINFTQCKEKCLANCSCTGYASADIRGTGCIIWMKDLVGLGTASYEGEDFYVRLAAAEIGTSIRNTITPTDQHLGENETLVSEDGTFALGFFRPVGNTNNLYMGLWYNKIKDKTVLWVANRESPVINSSTGFLSISINGNLIIYDQDSKVVWSSNTANVTNPVAQLLNSGNLVVRSDLDDKENSFAWQSFDYPTDTLIAGMKLGVDMVTGLNRTLIAWTSDSDPSPSQYYGMMDIHGDPQLVLCHGSKKVWRTGPWNGFRYSGVPDTITYSGFDFSFINNKQEITFSFNTNLSVFTRLVVNQSGVAQGSLWVEGGGFWNIFWYAPRDQCDYMPLCGSYTTCDPNNSPICDCIQGFTPKFQDKWEFRDGSDGCKRKTPLDCKNGTDGFLLIPGTKLPETSNSTVDMSLSLADCKTKCLNNCSCTAYAPADVRNGGSGCILWTTELTDLRVYTGDSYVQDLYVRLAAADLARPTPEKSRAKAMVTIITVLLGVALLISFIIFFAWRQTKMKRRAFVGLGIKEDDEIELPQLQWSTLMEATNNFAETNILGKGGFGVVYKGKLGEGCEMAVKRLSKNSAQGIDEFKNEVILIAQLQHRNLVRLLGYCIQGDERILVYEHMTNGSLDAFLFDIVPNRVRVHLDWPTRFHIIIGIARGLLYLHQDSRLKIIHRDIKASNILLDSAMNPKISDFGLARIFGENETTTKTKKVVGTYGYMAPEYALDGIFSVKSDVFSFGVLILEIISGQRNKNFISTPHLYFLGNAWSLWNQGNALHLLDPLIGDSFSVTQVMRCINIGLLCVQGKPEDRPIMSSVVSMLGKDGASLAKPKAPGFKAILTGELESTPNPVELHSFNNVTFTEQTGR